LGISHYSDLTDQEKFYLKAHLELGTEAKVSVKVDGSANIGFGLDDNGQVYIARFVKGQSTKIYDIDHYPKTPQYNAIRTAGSAILSSSHIISKVLKNGDYVNAEILYESIPNVIEYDGKNYIVLHDERFNGLDGYVFSSTINVYKAEGMEIVPQQETNDFEIKGSVKLSMSLPTDEKEVFPSSEEIFGLLEEEPLRDVWGNAAPFHEGIVVEYPNLTFKCVGDFPKINREKWRIREYLDNGYTGEDGWVHGLKYQYLNEISQVIGLPLLKAPSVKYYVNKKSDSYNFFDRMVDLLKEREIVVENDTISKIYSITTMFISVHLRNVAKEVEESKSTLDDINYRKTLESYLHHRDYYMSIEKHIGSVYPNSDKPIEQLASILCFILKEEIVKDTFMKKVFRFLKKPLTNNQ